MLYGRSVFVIFILILASFLYAGETTQIKTLDGEVIKVELTQKGMLFHGYEGKVILLEAFGYRCPPCLASIPGYNRIQKRHRNDVVVIAVESWSLPKDKLKKLVYDRKIEYKVVAKSDSGALLRFMEKLTGWNLNYGVPYLMIFSSHGTLSSNFVPGALNEAEVEKLIARILDKK
jgi:thiol-disulfide isomerase/thioredoxin